VVDIALVVLIILLSLKGFFNGFMREMVGFVGLIGGIFVASRASLPVGQVIGNFMHMDNMALLKLAGFLITLAVVWGGSSFVAAVFTALKTEPHSTSTRLLGMGVAGVKYLLIFAMIIASLFNNSMIRNNFAKSINSSRLFPIFNKTGSALVNIAPLPIISTADKKIQNSKK
jgi:membrane protein required for colicin V production